ncbi:UDP binding domain-containing protein [Nocardia heshunensis]
MIRYPVIAHRVDPRIQRLRPIAGDADRSSDRISQNQPGYVARRIITGLWQPGRPSDGTPRIVLVGATYKSDIGDIRDSCALKVATELRWADAEVLVVDPRRQC